MKTRTRREQIKFRLFHEKSKTAFFGFTLSASNYKNSPLLMHRLEKGTTYTLVIHLLLEPQKPQIWKGSLKAILSNSPAILSQSNSSQDKRNITCEEKRASVSHLHLVEFTIFLMHSLITDLHEKNAATLQQGTELETRRLF